VKFPRKSIHDAIASHLSPSLAERLALKGAEFAEDEIGHAIARALCSDRGDAAAAVDALTLHSVHLHGPQGAVTLCDDDAGEHPLLAPWLRYDFGDLIGQVLRSGTVMTNLTPGWPIFERVSLIESEGKTVSALARVLFRETEASAELCFGAVIDPNRYLVQKTIGGDGLFALGQALREGRAAYSAAVAATDAIEAVTRSIH